MKKDESKKADTGAPTKPATTHEVRRELRKQQHEKELANPNPTSLLPIKLSEIGDLKARQLTRRQR